eukprot:jgi/Antlo1/1587/739
MQERVTHRRDSPCLNSRPVLAAGIPRALHPANYPIATVANHCWSAMWHLKDLQILTAIRPSVVSAAIQKVMLISWFFLGGY